MCAVMPFQDVPRLVLQVAWDRPQASPQPCVGSTQKVHKMDGWVNAILPKDILSDTVLIMLIESAV